MQKIYSINCTGNHPEKGKRHYIMMPGFTIAQAEFMIALMYEVSKSGWDETAIIGIRDETFTKVAKSMEMIDGIPALRLPSMATEKYVSAIVEKCQSVRDDILRLLRESSILGTIWQQHDLN